MALSCSMSRTQLPSLASRCASLKMDALFEQLELGVLSTIDLLPQGKVGGRERRGPPIDALVEFVLGATQLLLSPSTDSHVGAQRQARDGDADHEHQQQQEGLIEIWLREGARTGERVPNRKAGEYQRDRRGIALTAAQC